MLITGPPFRIIENLMMTKKVQYFFPRSKKRRIREKCAKKYVVEVPSDEVIMTGNTIFCHPAVARQLRAEMRKNAERFF